MRIFHTSKDIYVDEGPLEIVYNDPVSEQAVLCGHCFESKDGHIVCPTVVRVYTSGGYDHTIVCVDCLMELLNK